LLHTPLWRVFPWDPSAEDGEPFSPSFIPPSSGQGRFDLPELEARLLYLAETPEHAVAEAIQGFRGARLREVHLFRAGAPLALCSVTVTPTHHGRVADLCDPQVLSRHRLPPDRIASRHRPVTRPIATALVKEGYDGLRWWSAFWGDWHTTVLFFPSGAPETSPLRFGDPEVLELVSPSLLAAAALLGVEVG
jgi:hypothetical protein